MADVTVENSKPTRCVVLGSQGFVGSHFVATIQAKNWNVLALASIDIDLTKVESNQKLTAVINEKDTLVFISALTPDKGRDRKTLLLNIAMADTVCAALESTICQHVVYISSDAVYDDSQHLIRETSACNPNSFHGIMHFTREKMLIEVCKRKNIPLLILRPTAVFGKGDTHNSYGPNRFIKTAKQSNEIALTGEGEELRDHISIQDLASITAELIEKKVSGTLNIATGKSVTFGSIAKLVQNALVSDVSLQNQVRQSPVTHRHFDISELIKVLPNVQFTSMQKIFEEIIKT